MKQFFLFFILGLLFLFSEACSQNWSKAIKKGKIQHEPFFETVDTEKSNGLLIVPVSINGEIYRFLFDTGAILCLSEELQEKYKYKTISNGNIVDSDRNNQL